MSLEYILYTDESDTAGACYSHFYGGALVRSPDLLHVQQTIQAQKDDLHLHNEIKWSKVTEQYLDKYVSLMNTFLDLIAADKVKLRIMFIANRHLRQDLPKYQRENKYHLLYYQFIKHAFGLRFSNQTGTPISVRVYVDQMPDTKEKNALFKSHLAALTKSVSFRTAQIVIDAQQIAEVDSHDHVVLQCLDVVLGAMQFRLNKKHLEKPPGQKRRGKKTIAKEKLYKLINHRIRQIYPHFNIGISTGKQGSFESLWRHPYRHWSFVSTNDLSATSDAVSPDGLT